MRARDDAVTSHPRELDPRNTRHAGKAHKKTLKLKCVTRMKPQDRMKYISSSTVAQIVFSHFRHSLCLEPAITITSYQTGKKLK